MYALVKLTGHGFLTIRKFLVAEGVTIRPRGNTLNPRKSPVLSQDDTIATLYIGGMTMAEIAEQLHWSAGAIRQSLLRTNTPIRRRGARMPNTKVSHEEYARTRELYRSGLNAREIAPMFGITQSAVYDRLDYMGEPRRNLSDRTHCIRGHEFVPENTRIDGRGHRVCRACQALAKREWRRLHEQANGNGQAQTDARQAA